MPHPHVPQPPIAHEDPSDAGLGPARLSDGELARLLAATPTWTWIFDEELRCVFRSAEVGASPSFPRDETMGHQLGEFMDDDGRDRAVAAAHTALAEPAVLQVVEVDATTPTGEVWPVQLRFRAVEHEGSRHVVMTARDLSSDRQSSDALRRRTELEHLLERVEHRFINVEPAEIDLAIAWALEEVGTFLGSCRAYLLHHDLAARTESMTHEWCAPGVDEELPTYQQVPFSAVPTGAGAKLGGEVVALRDLANAPPEWTVDSRFLGASGLVSILELPLTAKGSTVGSLGFDWTRELASWSDDDLVVLGLFAAAFSQLLARRAAEIERADLTAQIRRGFERSPAALAVVDVTGTLLQVNQALCTLVGHPSSELVGEFAGVLVRPEYLESCLEWGATLMAADGPDLPSFQAELRTGMGTDTWVEIRPQAVRDDRGDICQFVIQAQDITGQKLAERRRASSEARFAALVQHLPDPVVRLDSDLRVVFGNQAAQDLLEGLRLVPDRRHLVHDFVTHARAAFETGLMQTSTTEFETAVGPRAYENRFVPEPSSDGTTKTVLVVGVDLTDRRRNEAELAHRAVHDPLTELPNRTRFLSDLQDALDELADKGRGLVAVLFFDLDRFKVVNDSMGHAAGDELLRAVATRLQTSVRSGDVVARLGGDEFTVLLTSCQTTTQVDATAERLRAALCEPMMVGGRELVISGSVGVALATSGRETPDELMRGADAAMYRAKDRGRSRVVTFDAALAAEAQERLELDQRLRHARDNDEFEVWFQPEVDLETGETVGAEALLRWRTPEGVRSAGEFIWLAEETGIIVPIGNWVLQEACHWAGRWERAGREMVVRVNLSARQFDQPDLVDIVARALARSGLSGRSLCLEITETALMADAEASRAMLRELDRLGVQLAIDDFGTGYSSLSYLKQFPVDVLKIDRTFVDGLPDDAEDLAIVTTIIRLAESLGMVVTAEGIETASQATSLLHLGCRLGQGFHFARPMPAIEMQALLDVRQRT